MAEKYRVYKRNLQEKEAEKLLNRFLESKDQIWRFSAQGCVLDIWATLRKSLSKLRLSRKIYVGRVGIGIYIEKIPRRQR